MDNAERKFNKNFKLAVKGRFYLNSLHPNEHEHVAYAVGIQNGVSLQRMNYLHG